MKYVVRLCRPHPFLDDICVEERRFDDERQARDKYTDLLVTVPDYMQVRFDKL